ncbi:hypothetical protein VCHA54P486_160075 [Vibrio chagasii]|nr:hypothetical protein VCHA54P495_150025 [Vibrio chagasii]CAH7216645.1 hypothetical protein VCHA54P486_160075 [Vibrio chagasii]
MYIVYALLNRGNNHKATKCSLDKNTNNLQLSILYIDKRTKLL